ncbi:MAG: MFS transporter [Pseudomonadota bacterium]
MSDSTTNTRTTSLFSYLSLIIAAAAAYSMSTLFSAMKPILLTRFVEQVSFAESLAGLIVATPFVGIALSALIVKPVTRHLSTFAVFLCFGGLLVLAEAVSAYVFHTPIAVLTAQLVAGLSVGILMGATSQLIAVTEKPDEIFGVVDMTAVLLMSFMVAGLGNAVGRGGLFAGYWVAAGIALLFAILLFAYRRPNDEVPAERAAKPMEFSVKNVAVVTMGVLFVTCSGLGFAFMFTLAQNLQMSYETAGSQIGILLLVSAGACLLGGWCSAKFGPIRPLGCAFITCAVGWYMAVHASEPIVFIAALVPAIFSLQFNFPILLAFSGSLDNTGQWAAVATPLLTSGFAWAAIVAGLVVETWGLEAIATATGIGMLGCLGLLGVVVRTKTKD